MCSKLCQNKIIFCLAVLESYQYHKKYTSFKMVSSPDKFCLKWNDFQTNISSSYRDLRETNEFSDVTLVSEDNQQIEAHRVILSACSPFFMTVFKKNKHPHPMIYMWEMKSKDLIAIVDFIYQGEANIFQDDLDNFLSFAEKLQLRGLSGQERKNEQSDQHGTGENKQSIKSKPTPESDEVKRTLNVKQELSENTPNISFDERTLSLLNKSIVSIDNTNELDEQINSMMQRIEGSKDWECKVCGKVANYKNNIRQHIEANHIEGATHPCQLCGKISRSRNGLTNHVLRFHKRS